MIERADQAIGLGLLAIPMVMQEAAAAIAGLRECLVWRIAESCQCKNCVEARNALAALSAAPGREGVDGGHDV